MPSTTSSVTVSSPSVDDVHIRLMNEISGCGSLREGTIAVLGVLHGQYRASPDFEKLVEVVYDHLVAVFWARKMSKGEAKRYASKCLAEAKDAVLEIEAWAKAACAPKPALQPILTAERMSMLIAKAAQPERQARHLLDMIRTDARYTPNQVATIEMGIRVELTLRFVRSGEDLRAAQQHAEQVTAAPKPRRMPSADERKRPAPKRPVAVTASLEKRTDAVSA